MYRNDSILKTQQETVIAVDSTQALNENDTSKWNGFLAKLI